MFQHCLKHGVMIVTVISVGVSVIRVCVVTESEKTLAELRRDTERDRHGRSEQEGAQLQEELCQTRAASESLEQVLAPCAAPFYSHNWRIMFKHEGRRHDTSPRNKICTYQIKRDFPNKYLRLNLKELVNNLPDIIKGKLSLHSSHSHRFAK